jgi:potassium-transporting ATPase KdpC subunit
MRTLKISIKIFLFFTVLTGIIYPLLITGIAQLAFPWKANGSMVVKDNETIGSELIGQQFDSAIYFSSRPSAISYNTLPSGGSNYGLTNAKLKEAVDQRRKQFITFNKRDSTTEVPPEMLFASASGLDPHISPASALLQVDRIAEARGFNSSQKQQVIDLIRNKTENLQFFILGESRINVLILNIELDELNKNIINNK